ncbi:MAG: (Fe-S)-binding protein [Bacteroidetes bacterium]|nr:(Fe-S)-binding protein [Bacteroidota bacterium]MBL7103450.1 (Fe-S)-binding protein [Bacteroidales bacterium]
MAKNNSLTEKQKKALKLLKSRLNGRLLTHLNSCVHCGLCGESCHYYLATKNKNFIPGKKVDIVSSIYQRYHTLAGKVAPRLYGAKDFNDKTVEELIDIVFGACSMCGRCSVHCSIGVDVPYIVRTARSMLVEMELVSPGLQSTVDAAINTGNNMGIPRDEFVDTLEWLSEDLEMEVEDEDASIPLDKKGVDILYTLNPREPKFFPLSISAIAKIYYAAKENWTLSTNVYDVTNYAYFSGDDKGAKELTERLCDEMSKLEAKTLVLAECGHGYRAIRWEGPNWIERPYPFKVISVVELIGDYIRSCRIKLDPSLNKLPVTLHDPCNMVRGGGVIEVQRFVIKNAVENFIEMMPNRANNFCCGGGGGQLAMSEYAERRIKSGKIKADQIRKTGAKIVATPCHNCIDQLMELNKEYQLGVEIKTIGELVADALVLEEKSN